MSGNPYFNDSVQEQVTDLLMENGCTVNRPAMIKLTEYIARRDQSTCDQFVRQAEQNLAHLQSQTRVTDMLSTDSKPASGQSDAPQEGKV